MKKSFMNNIKHFVDSNVRQRIDRAANNNNDFFGDDLLLVERQFEDMRHVCVEAEKRISALLQSLASSPLGAYTQNVQASLNTLSTNLSTTNSSTSLAVASALTPTPSASTISTNHHQIGNYIMVTHPNQANGTQASSHHSKQSNQSCKFKPGSIINESSATLTPTQAAAPTLAAASYKGSNTQLHASNSGLSETTVLREDIRRHKKLPIVGFLKFLVKSCYKLRPDSLLANTMTHCSQLQTQLTKLYLSYEQTIELQCLKPIQHIIEIDVPNVIKLRKLFIKSYNDLESVKVKYNGASQKQQQQLHASHSTSTSYTITQNSVQQANINKLDQLKKELDDAVTRFEQARDNYATELYAFVCRETELVNFFMKFYQYQAEYQQQVGDIIQNSLPSLRNMLAFTPRKVVFGTPLEENLRCTGRSVSLVIELCVHILYSRALNEEGLFRIPGSSIKIKKLKNAINAWFVTLASQSELENDQQGAHSSVLAVHDLFKEITGQRPQQFQTNSDTNASNQINPSARDDSASNQMNLLSTQNEHEFVFDVHTIAGLLKLYLRELPEPLFTHALYQQCLDATSKALNDNQPEALEQVIQQLPKANYDNLHHLIRFLHLLTCHREINKMTATNLAITMAPSLIWACPNEQVQSDQQTVGGGEQTHDDMQMLNLQMSNVGISASLHALVIENLINNAEKLFPGATQFSISGLDEVFTGLCDKQSSNQDRCIESNSPTGLSTASSSSFSSSSNTSLTSSMNKKHSRKGGSMEGLLGNLSGKNVDINRSSGTIRPISVQLNRRELSHGQLPPPIPPAPVARSHVKNVGELTPTLRSAASSHKPPAPPIPPPSNLKRQQYINSSSNLSNQTINGNRTFSSLVQSALASSGTLQMTGSISAHNSLRPSVPPPTRPQRATPDDKNDTRLNDNQAQINGPEEIDDSPQGDSKSSHSFASSGNFRADFEEINAIDVDDISVPSVSPIVSLDDTVSGDDSSFDNECHSLEHSWTDYDLESPLDQVGTGKSSQNISSKPINQKTQEDNQKPQSSMSAKQSEIISRKQDVTCRVIGDGTDGSPTSPPPPIKPPRSLSPKVTQSTLL